MSVFKSYDKNSVNQKIFKNQMYFPRGKAHAKPYKKAHELILIEWLEEVLLLSNKNYFFDKNVLYKGLKEEQKGVKFDNKKDTDDEDQDEINETIDKDLSFLIKNILMCTKEIIHNKIASNKNFIDTSVLQCLGLSALMLSIKVYLAYDWDYNYEDPFEEIANLTDGACSKNQLLDMEEDLLKSSNWIPCIKNQYKSKHLPGAWKDKEYMVNPHDYVGRHEIMQAKSKRFKNKAKDSIAKHFSLLDKKNTDTSKKAIDISKDSYISSPDEITEEIDDMDSFTTPISKPTTSERKSGSGGSGGGRRGREKRRRRRRKTKRNKIKKKQRKTKRK